MNDVQVKVFDVTMTAFDSRTKTEITTAEFRVFPDGDPGRSSAFLPMYDKAKAPIVHSLSADSSADPNKPQPTKWLVQALNRYGPVFNAECELDVLKTTSLRFVVVQGIRGTVSRKRKAT